jgi:hypothetical protein
MRVSQVPRVPQVPRAKIIIKVLQIYPKAVWLVILVVLLLPVIPVSAQESTSYKLKGYEFGGGGGINIESSSYSMEGILGESAGELDSASYTAGSGLIFVQNANVPPSPTFVNSEEWYNKLHLTINKDAGDPTDAKYAIAISNDNFISDTRYVQDDNTIGATLGSEDFQSYTDWGGALGEYIIGLERNTTYTVKVTSTQGKYTQSGYSATAQASTSDLILTFDLDVASTDTETGAPYTVSVGSLIPGSVTTASDKVWVDFATNADYGGYIYLTGLNTGLKSTNVNYTITSATSNLASLEEGYGIQSSTTSESSGGPITAVSPYNGTSDNVGVVDTTTREIYSSTSPVTGGRSSFVIKAKSKSTTPSASDFTDTLTVIASATF